MKKFLSVMLVCVMMASAVVFASCGSNGDNYASGNTEFYIGCSGPLTGSAGVYGNAVKNGAQMAVDEINADGGINGVKIKFVMMDDKSDVANVSTNYNKMLEDGMQASLGCVTTNPCLEYKALSKEDNVFFITPSASNDAVPEFDNGYQMCFADGNQGKAAALYVNAACAGQTIGVLYRSDDAYSTGILEQFKSNISSDITLVEANFQGETVASFDSQINQLKDCKFIFMPIYYTPASQFMVQAKNVIAPDAVYYGCDGLDGIDKVDGFDIYSIPQEVSYLSHFNSKATEGPAAEFVNKYVAAYGSETLNQFGASAYDCIYAIKDAVVKAGDKITVTTSASDVCEALKEVFNGGFTFTGITGEYKDGVQTSMTWESNGYVNKTATKFVVKAAGEEGAEK